MLLYFIDRPPRRLQILVRRPPLLLNLPPSYVLDGLDCDIPCICNFNLSLPIGEIYNCPFEEADDEESCQSDQTRKDIPPELPAHKPASPQP